MAPSSSSAADSSSRAFVSLWNSYYSTTSYRLKLIDAYLLFIILSGIAQFVYCVLVTNFPFNAFLAGFASTVGQFVLAASLRSQSNPANKEFEISPERAFGDFIFGSIILHFFVVNFIG